jgi:predicted ester cyclase
MPPTTMDGLHRENIQSSDSEKSQQLVINMLDELGHFDGKSLESMKLQNFWHDDFMWYGPAGIGTTRGIEGFRSNHQGPFVFSFPDRSVDHKATIVANGNYVATGGWPHMHGTHTSGYWLGLPPSKKEISLRVMDIWRREGDLLKENWVAIDIIDMCMQMGLDVFAMMKQQFKGS